MHDSSKFEKTAFSNICSLEDIDVLVTDRYPGDHWAKLLDEFHVELLCPGKKNPRGL